MAVNKSLFSGKLGLFGLGVAAGFTIIKLWPKISATLEPFIKLGIAKGLDVADKGKEIFWEKSEKFADVISEIKEEEEAKTKDKTKEKPINTQAKASTK